MSGQEVVHLPPSNHFLHISDPLSQSFFVDKTLYPEGVFVTGGDLFFKTKSNKIPVKLSLRQAINGYPDSFHDIPGSVFFLQPKDINISNDASIPTHFSFDYPIFISAGETHFTSITDITEYTAYVANLGEYQLGTTTERITKDAYSGTLFKSANSIDWLPLPETDIKFVLYRAKFDTMTPSEGTFCLKNDHADTINYNSLCMNASIIKPDNTTISTPIHQFDVDYVTNPKSVSINFNETVELKNTFTITEI